MERRCREDAHGAARSDPGRLSAARAAPDRIVQEPGGASFRITTESGIRSTGEAMLPTGRAVGTALIVAPGSNSPQPGDRIAKDLNRHWLASGFAILNVTDSRLTPGDMAHIAPVAGVADHNPAEWGLWVNRPLLGQWTWDLIRWLDFLDERSALRADQGGESLEAGKAVRLDRTGRDEPAGTAGGRPGRARGRRFLRRRFGELRRSRCAAMVGRSHGTSGAGNSRCG